jgi:hypothetical protein
MLNPYIGNDIEPCKKKFVADTPALLHSKSAGDALGTTYPKGNRFAKVGSAYIYTPAGIYDAEIKAVGSI